ncbi:proline iminopeptidase [Sphingomonas jejuensis]|uniref:Proline iminopeptidase n=1 Tax=Sphingomonas jejuensis TaxID=904715 RepID=A0ABX0XMB9_9SPHN|nr:alpha/beta hydrolase [Sphingomonas jejuensis]NJC33954.1 proline iminopeptidase [Sphingomonas jejuensis]
MTKSSAVDRRVALAVLAAALVPGRAIAAAPDDGLTAINGRRLWVLDHGDPALPALLYVHGGPGVGAFDFERHMMPHLDGRYRVVSVDQRGALRSDPIAADAPVTVDDLIADYEAIRERLGIARWTLIGHSFGGLIALRYVLAHPQGVTRLVLESPVIDAASSLHWLMGAAAQRLNGIDTAAALEAVTLSSPTTPVDPAFVPRMERVMAALGPRRQDLYVVQAEHRAMFSRLAEQAPFPEDRWSRGERPGRALLNSPDLYRPMLASVASVSAPLLLVRGAGDHVTSPAEIDAVARAGGRVVTIDGAGHFVHVEQPDALAAALTG